MLFLGVQEAFLKLAQGVITLYQHNQLSGPPLEPSYSPLTSFTTQQQQQQQDNITSKHLVDSSGHMNHQHGKSGTTEGGGGSKCC